MSLKSAARVIYDSGIYDSDPIFRTSFVCLVCADNTNHTYGRELRLRLQVHFSPATSHQRPVRPASLLHLLPLTHLLLAAWTQKGGMEGVWGHRGGKSILNSGQPGILFREL